MQFETRAIHEGQEPDPASGAITTPIYHTSTYVQEAVGVHKGYDYARVGNTTRTALQECLASLESAAHGRAFSSTSEAIMALDKGEITLQSKVKIRFPQAVPPFGVTTTVLAERVFGSTS